MPKHRENCKPKEWLQSRRALADALASGHFQQQPHQVERVPMRDDQDRYTVTGVAACLSPNVWVQLEDQWHAVWTDELSELNHTPPQPNGDMSGLSELEQHRILQRTAGNVVYMPEITACGLGLYGGHEHPSELQIHPAAFLTQVQKQLGLPRRTEAYPADYLSFEQAATLITLHPMALGPCGCDLPDTNDNETSSAEA